MFYDKSGPVYQSCKFERTAANCQVDYRLSQKMYLLTAPKRMILNAILT